MKRRSISTTYQTALNDPRLLSLCSSKATANIPILVIPILVVSKIPVIECRIGAISMQRKTLRRAWRQIRLGGVGIYVARGRLRLSLRVSISTRATSEQPDYLMSFPPRDSYCHHGSQSSYGDAGNGALGPAIVRPFWGTGNGQCRVARG